MAAATKTNISSIALALAGKSTSVDIPKPRDGEFWAGKDTFAAVAARSLPEKPRSSGLPTPPNSISPSLPPHGYKSRLPDASPSPPPHPSFDSDIDLQDAVDHENAQVRSHRGTNTQALNRDNLEGLDSVGAITPGLLAKHHLPNILLNHGPLAIRHVMGYLTASVPGFSRIPPAKARRLVVAALEGRGSGGEGAGLHSDVEFEKVGWGRWGAKRRAGVPKDNQGIRRVSPLLTRRSASGRRASSPFFQGGIRIPLRGSRPEGSGVKVRPLPQPDRTQEDNLGSSHRLPPLGMLDEEADRMSLDGDEACSSSDAPEDPYALAEDDVGEATDEEDWASIGAAALRQGSYQSKSGGGHMHNHYLPTPSLMSEKRHRQPGRGGGPSSVHLAKSAPTPNIPLNFQRKENLPPIPPVGGSSNQHLQAFFGMEGIESDSQQEREAIEALVRLSSI